MAGNSVPYFLNLYSNTGTAFYCDFKTSGAYLNNVTGVSGLNGGIFYKDYNSSIDNMHVVNVNLQYNAAIAPDGTKTAIKLIPNTTNGQHYIANYNIGSGNTFSCYLKSSSEFPDAFLRFTQADNGGTANDCSVDFSLANGTFSNPYYGQMASMVSVGNGWYKCSTAYQGSGVPGEVIVEILQYPWSDAYAFTFSGNNSSGIYFWGGQIETGITSGNYSNGFWQNSGSGFYNGTYSYIPTTGTVNLNNATYLTVYQKTTPSDGLLISTAYTGVDPVFGKYTGGFDFGVTANNYLYFNYYVTGQTQTFTSDVPLPDKVSAFVTLQNNLVSFGNYDYYAQQFNSVNYPINSNYLFNPSGIYLGANPIMNNSRPFTGYIDEFLVFSPSVYPSLIKYINSGFAYDYSVLTSGPLSGQFTGVTGTQVYVTGYYTTVTGYNVIPTGVIYDYFGNQYTGVQVVPLSLTVSGTGLQQLTGVTSQITGYSSVTASLFYNTGYVGTFGKSTINLLSPIISGDVVDINLPTNGYPFGYENNLRLSYNTINGGCFSNTYLKSNPNLNYIVFQNGLTLNSGAYSVTGTVGNSGIRFSNDYYIDQKNNIFLANGFNGLTDNISVAYADTFTGTYDTGLYIENFSLNGAGAVMVKNILPYGNSFDQWTLQEGKLLARKNLLTYSNNFLTPNFGNLVNYSNSFSSWYGYYALPANLQKNATDPFGGTNNAWSFPITGVAAAGHTVDFGGGSVYTYAGFINNNAGLGGIPDGTPLVASVWLKTDNPTGVYISLCLNDCAQFSVPISKNWQRYYYYTTININCGSGPRGLQLPVSIKYGAMPTGNVYVYGAQLEANSTVPGAYIENGATATTYNTAALPWTLRNTTLYPSQNLLLYSEQLGQYPWGVNATTITSNAVIAPDGSLSADKLTSTSNDAYLYQWNNATSPVLGSTYVGSIWLRSDSPMSYNIYIVGYNGTVYGYTVCNVTTNWQRFSVNGVISTIPPNAPIIYFQIGGGGSLTNGNYIYAWGAQLEANTTIAGTYIATTSSVSTTVYNSQSDPFGGTGALKLIENNSNASHDLYIDSNSNSYGPGSYTYSTYLKSGENRYVNISLVSRDGGNVTAALDLGSGSVLSSSYHVGNWDAPTARITGVGSGWYRCSVSANYGKNLMRSSNKFTDTTAWLLFGNVGSYAGNTILSGNQISDPFSSMGASLLVRTGSALGPCVLASDYRIMPTQPSTTYTYSVYFTTGYKIGGSAELYFFGYNQNGTNFNYLNNGTYSNIGFNLSSALTGTITSGANTGTIFANNNQVSRTCTPVGNGWYRHQFTFQTASSGYYLSTFLQLQSDGAYVASGAYVGIYGQQLELGPSATQYLDTATGAAYLSGIGIGLEMTKSAGSLYQEYQGSGMNGIYVYGQQLSDNSQPCPYVATTGTVSATGYKFVSDPFGGTNAVKLLDSTNQNSHYIITSVSKGNSIAPYTFSVYAKAAEYSAIAVDMSDFFAGDAAVVFNLTNGTVFNSLTQNGGDWASTSGNIESIRDGWYRCSLSSTQLGLSSTVAPRITLVPNTGAGASWIESYIGDGVSGVYLYGAQLETGIFPGHYIDNTGTQLNYVYSLPWDPAQNNIFYNGQKLLTGTNASVQNGAASIGYTSYAYTTGKNLLLYSQEFNSSAWSLGYSASSGTLSIINAQTDPFGGSNGSLLQYTGRGNSSCTLHYDHIIVKPSTVYTFSVYLTTGSLINGGLGYSYPVYDTVDGTYPTNFLGDLSRSISISYIETGGYAGNVYHFPSYALFGPDTFPITGASSHTSTYINNGWYRHQWTFNTSQYARSMDFNLWMANYGGATVSGSTMGVFGAQLEYGSGATSYSRTSSTINTTRTNGVYFLSGSQPFSSSSGNLFALPRNFQTEITGSAQTFYNLPQFYDNFSEVYKNGQRLAVEQDYLELGQYDINSGQGIFDTKPYLLYNNSDLF